MFLCALHGIFWRKEQIVAPGGTQFWRRTLWWAGHLGDSDVADVASFENCLASTGLGERNGERAKRRRPELSLRIRSYLQSDIKQQRLQSVKLSSGREAVPDLLCELCGATLSTCRISRLGRRTIRMIRMMKIPLQASLRWNAGICRRCWSIWVNLQVLKQFGPHAMTFPWHFHDISMTFPSVFDVRNFVRFQPWPTLSWGLGCRQSRALWVRHGTRDRARCPRAVRAFRAWNRRLVEASSGARVGSLVQWTQWIPAARSLWIPRIPRIPWRLPVAMREPWWLRPEIERIERLGSQVASDGLRLKVQKVQKVQKEQTSRIFFRFSSVLRRCQFSTLNVSRQWQVAPGQRRLRSIDVLDIAWAITYFLKNIFR